MEKVIVNIKEIKSESMCLSFFLYKKINFNILLLNNNILHPIYITLQQCYKSVQF